MKSGIVILVFHNKQHYRVVTGYCRHTNKSLDVCIFAHFKLNCEVMPLRTFANFKLVMSNYRKELRGALGHGLVGLCVNPSLYAQFYGSFHLCKVKISRLKTLFSSVRWGANVDKRKAACWIFLFSYVAIKQRILHHFYLLTAASVPPK